MYTITSVVYNFLGTKNVSISLGKTHNFYILLVFLKKRKYLSGKFFL